MVMRASVVGEVSLALSRACSELRTLAVLTTTSSGREFKIGD
jgi:hypothetical protein